MTALAAIVAAYWIIGLYIGRDVIAFEFSASALAIYAASQWSKYAWTRHRIQQGDYGICESEARQAAAFRDGERFNERLEAGCYH